MKSKECENKINEMLPEANQRIMGECERLFKSGAIDTSSYPDDEYSLPKILLSVALLNVANDLRPLSKPFRDDWKNLLHF